MTKSMKPIPFNMDMTRAIRDDRKTVTRRPVKYTAHDVYGVACARGLWYETYDTQHLPESLVEWYVKSIAKPPYQPGEILYVPEAWRCFGYVDLGTTEYCVEFRDRKIARFNFQSMERAEKWAKYLYKPRRHWQSPYFMPREAARLFLRVTDVRVERLQDIDEDGAKDEGSNLRNGRYVGVDEKMRRSAVERFAEIWDSTIKSADIARYGWVANPWVWVIEFERCEKPEKGET